jgi:hypothetical protein
LDSSEDEEFVPAGRGIGRGYEDTELPTSTPKIRKRNNLAKFFLPVRKGSTSSKILPVEAPATALIDAGDGHGNVKSSSGSIVSKRTGKEKRFQGLRKLFRIHE